MQALLALLALVFAACFVPVAAALPNPNQGSGGPILVVTSTAATFGTYYAEILRSEGLTEFTVADIAAVDATTLAGYDVVILAKTPALTSGQVTMFGDWVTGGGNLIAMSPDPGLATLLGIAGAGGTLTNGYLLIDTTSKAGNGLVGQTIQFHGSADRYTLNGAASIATLYSDAATPTANPAVTLRTVGSGQAAAFTYDLATSVVYTRQGNPSWAALERDGFTPIRSDDKYFGNASFDPQRDWVDLSKVAIPQADEQQRLLANLILTMNLNRKPLPRFWYFPNGKKAVVIMTGDDHANGGTAGRFDQFNSASPAGCDLANWDCVRGTSYLYPGSPLTNTQAASYNAQGFEIGVHISTNCADFTSTANLDSFYTQQIATWSTQYSSVPPPITERVHCIAWSDWSSEPQVELAHGIRLDTSYYYWPPSWINDIPGVFTGSAMPMRFATLSGTLLDVYQATSQMTDESGQSFPFTIDTLLDRAVGAEGYYGAYTVNAHTDFNPSDVANAVVASAKARSVPIVSSVQMLNWLDGRNSSTFTAMSWSGSALGFTIAPGSNTTGLQAMLPTQAGRAGTLATLTLNGGNIAFTTTAIKGITYAMFPAAAGSYVATYIADTTAPTVTAKSPADGATGVSMATSIGATFSEAMDASTITSTTFELRDSSGILVPSTVTYNAGTSVATLTPSAALSASATYTAKVLGGTTGPVPKDLAGNALAGSVSWSFTTGAGPACPCSVWSTTTTPANPSVADANAVELGVKFTSDFSGTITGIRFYKGSGNTGTHVGHLWSSTGQLLGSVTFTSETATGWQSATFVPPIAITAGAIYVASYFAPNGDYAADSLYFSNAGVDNFPLHLLKDGVSGGNGLFAYGASGTFPVNTFQSTNYWVDVVFATGAPDTTPPTVTSKSPAAGATGVGTSASITATFSEALNTATISGSTFTLATGSTSVPATVSYDTGTSVATLTPSAPLAAGVTYTATIAGGAGGVKDPAGNALATNVTWSFTTQTAGTCPCSAFGASATPGTPADSDASSVEVGVKFRADVDGSITGIRFYKGSGNTGTHVGNLWSSAGQRLATATFTNETATGWQQVNFATPVAITANTVYVASYLAPSGHYAADNGFFATAGVDNAPLHLLKDGVSGGNGVFTYGTTSTFPTSSFQSTNYWVDVVFATSTGPDTTPPTITAQTPAPGAGNVSTNSVVTATFSEAIDPTTITTSANTFRLASGTTSVPATISYDSGSLTATLTPSSPLTVGVTYTATVIGGANGVKDLAGNALVANVSWSFTTGTGVCAAPANAIVGENCLPGNNSSEWDVSGEGDTTIQGFATDISVDRGATIGFKIDTNATNYRLDIYRMGYYAGKGARYITTVNPSAALPQTQPSCLTQSTTTGLVDCGNWALSASWTVPSSAVSGIYFAKVVRPDTGGASHIVFIVRDDASTSALFFQTSDTTWQAYNDYGGKSLYSGGPGTNPARAYKVSYNRPFRTRAVDGGQDWVFNAEYPMVRWLESNGYDVSYTTGLDSDRNGSLIQRHKVFMSVGHDEYWSAGQRTNVENARNAGVNLAFFSGNEVFWKTRWENSIDASNTANRTLVSYKETHANKIIDPADPPTATPTWLDPRFGPGGSISPTADGGRPGNSLAGTMYLVNDGATTAITVPAADGKMRLWRNTSIATLANGTTATLAPNTLGYEWDSDLDNGFRPAGIVRLSTTVVNNAPVLLDFGSTYGSDTATHYMTLYKHASGARVFGAGTVQWSWGLDSNHDRGSAAADVRMQQATVNLFADLNVQPTTLQSGLVAATASTDATPPTSVITSPTNGSTVSPGTAVTITGTAIDAGGGVVGGIEVSVDNGATWHPASGRASWTYAWTTPASGTVTIKSRAVDDSGNLETPGAGVTVTAGSGTGSNVLVGDATIHTSVDSDAAGLAEAFQYTATASGTGTTLNLYVDPNNGAAKILVGLYSDNGSNAPGSLLAQATINAPTSGWNAVTLPSTSIVSGTKYWIAVLSPSGSGVLRFRDTSGGGGRAQVSAQTTLAVLPATWSSGANFIDGPMSAYVTQDAPDTTAPVVTATTPSDGATGVVTSSSVTATFNEALNAASITSATFTLVGPGGASVSATVSYNGTTFVATLKPGAALAGNTTYLATVKGGASGVKDAAGNPLAADKTWSFTTAAADTTAPTVTSVSPADGATGIGTTTNVTATFSEAVDPATVTASTFVLTGPAGSVTAPVTLNAGQTIATLNPGSSLLAGTTYTATVSGGTNGVKDLAGNPLAANKTWTFTTLADTTPPTVASTTPTSGATSVATNTTVTAKFSEGMNAATIGAGTFKLAAGATSVLATVGYNGTTFVATLTPSAPLAAGTVYTATVVGGGSGVKDLAGNALASDFTWSFTTLAASSVLVGDTTIRSTVDSNKAGIAEAFLYTATASGTAATMNVYVDASNAAKQIVVGLYSHNATSNAPATLLAQTTINTPVTGWNAVALPATSIASGTKYWIAVLGPSGGGLFKFRDATGSRSQVSKQTTLATLPATWTSGRTFSSGPISAYASQ